MLTKSADRSATTRSVGGEEGKESRADMALDFHEEGWDESTFANEDLSTKCK
jgi:hypothetical protein